MDESGRGENEEDPAYAKEVLRNGTIAYHIRSPGQGGDSIFLCTHFGFKIDRLVLCGICPSSHAFPLTSVIQDVARWLHNHWRYLAHGSTNNSLLPVHDKNKLPPVVQISKLLASSLDVAHENVPLSAFNVYHRSTGLILLEESWLASRYVSLGGFAQMAGDVVSVCRKCLGTVRKSLICCTSSQVIKVKCLHPGPRIRNILCTSNSTILDDQVSLLPNIAQAATKVALTLSSLNPVQPATLPALSTLHHAQSTVTPPVVSKINASPTSMSCLTQRSSGAFAIDPVSRTDSSSSKALSASCPPTVSFAVTSPAESNLCSSPPTNPAIVFGGEVATAGIPLKRRRFAVIESSEDFQVIEASGRVQCRIDYDSGEAPKDRNLDSTRDQDLSSTRSGPSLLRFDASAVSTLTFVGVSGKEILESKRIAQLELELEILSKRLHEVEELRLCSICLERKRDRCISCGHTFCTVCTELVMQVKPSVCPTCRAEVHGTFPLFVD